MEQFIINRILEIYNNSTYIDDLENPEGFIELKNIDSALKEYQELLSNEDIREKYKSSIDEKLIAYSSDFEKINDIKFIKEIKIKPEHNATAIAELVEKSENDKLELETAIAEIIEMQGGIE